MERQGFRSMNLEDLWGIKHINQKTNGFFSIIEVLSWKNLNGIDFRDLVKSNKK